MCDVVRARRSTPDKHSLEPFTKDAQAKEYDSSSTTTVPYNSNLCAMPEGGQWNMNAATIVTRSCILVFMIHTRMVRRVRRERHSKLFLLVTVISVWTKGASHTDSSRYTVSGPPSVGAASELSTIQNLILAPARQRLVEHATVIGVKIGLARSWSQQKVPAQHCTWTPIAQSERRGGGLLASASHARRPSKFRVIKRCRS